MFKINKYGNLFFGARKNVAAKEGKRERPITNPLAKVFGGEGRVLTKFPTKGNNLRDESFTLSFSLNRQ